MLDRVGRGAGGADRSEAARASPEGVSARLSTGGAGRAAHAGLAEARGVLASAARSVGGGGVGGGVGGEAGRAVLREAATALTGDLVRLGARDPGGLGDLLRAAFGTKADGPAGRALGARLAAGDVPMPALRLVGDETLPAGARGAYSSRGGGTVFLHRELMGDPAALRRVLAEELGHHLDRLLGGGDAKGDEGALFARLLAGERLGAGEMARLRVEDDRGRLRDGRAVEFDGIWSSYTVERAREELNPDPRGRHQLPDIAQPEPGPSVMTDPPDAPTKPEPDASPQPGPDLAQPDFAFDLEGSSPQPPKDDDPPSSPAEVQRPYTTKPEPRPDDPGDEPRATDDETALQPSATTSEASRQPEPDLGRNAAPSGPMAGGERRSDDDEGTAAERRRAAPGSGASEGAAADPRAAWCGPDGRLPGSAQGWLDRAEATVDRWAQQGAAGRAAMDEAADLAEAQPHGPDGRPAPEAWALARALAEAAERGQGSERFEREALERAMSLDPLGAAQGHADRGGTFGRALAGEGLATRAEALDAVGRSHVSEGTGRWMLSGLVAEGGLSPNTLDGRAAKASRREGELALRREVAQAWAEAYTDASEASEARTAERLEALLASPEGRAWLAEIGEMGRERRMGWLDHMANNPVLAPEAMVQLAKGGGPGALPPDVAAPLFDPATPERRRQQALEEGLGIDAGAALGAYEGRRGQLGRDLADLPLESRAQAMTAIAGGALEPGEARRVIEGLLSRGWVDRDLRGGTRDHASFAQSLAQAMAGAYLPEAPQAERQDAADRLFELARSGAGSRLLGAAADMDPETRRTLVEEIATNPALTAEAAREAEWDRGLVGAASAALRNPRTWRALGEFALDFYPPTALALGAYEFYRALKSGEPSALALAAAGFLPGPLGELGQGTLKMVGRRLDNGWSGPRPTRPSAQDPRVEDLYNQIYREADRFPGGTSGILVRELDDPSTWVTRRSRLEPPHLQKANDRLNSINNLLGIQKDGSIRLPPGEKPVPNADRRALDEVRRDLKITIDLAEQAIKDHRP